MLDFYKHEITDVFTEQQLLFPLLHDNISKSLVATVIQTFILNF